MTLIELLVVMAILALLMGALGSLIYMNFFEPPPEASDIALISIALDEYNMVFRAYPPDNGFGLEVDAGSPHYDPGSLWRHLTRVLEHPKTGLAVKPFMEWPEERMKTYNDPVRGESMYLVDPWGNRFGFIADRKRTLHNIGRYDLFSPGRNRETACGTTDQGPNDTSPGANKAYNGKDDDGNSVVDDREELGDAMGNGEAEGDSNNWSGG